MDYAENVAKLRTIVKSLSEPTKQKVKDLLNSPLGKEFRHAPASTKTKYHNCFDGGLLDHSLNVWANLGKLTFTFGLTDKYSTDTLNIVSIFHDLGKAGDGTNPLYIPKNSKWHNDQGILYEINEKCLPMPHAELSTLLLRKNGFDLTDDEYLAIRLHDGQYVDYNKTFSMKEPELALLLHWADMWSTKQEKEQHSK